MQQVSVSELAKMLNLSVRWVQQLASEGVLPKATRGSYPLEHCMRAYIRYLQDTLKRRETLAGRTTAEKIRVARVELLNAQKEKLTRENLAASGQLIPLEVFSHRMASMIVTSRQNLLQLPERIAPQLEAEPRAVIKEKLRAEIYSALRALATPATFRKAGACDVCGHSIGENAPPGAPDGLGARLS